MDKSKFYTILAVATSSFGAGMLIAAQLANGTSNTPYWLGGILVLAGAVVLGMSIATKSNSSSVIKKDEDVQP